MNKPLEPRQIAEQSNVRHELWLIYSQLRDAENDPIKRLAMLERSRDELGKVLNELNRRSSILELNESPTEITPFSSGKYKLSRQAI